MKVFIHPKKIEGFSQITSLKEGLKKLQEDLHYGGYLKEKTQINAQFIRQKMYINYTCNYANCPWKLQYSRSPDKN